MPGAEKKAPNLPNASTSPPCGYEGDALEHVAPAKTQYAISPGSIGCSPPNCIVRLTPSGTSILPSTGSFGSPPFVITTMLGGGEEGGDKRGGLGGGGMLGADTTIICM